MRLLKTGLAAVLLSAATISGAAAQEKEITLCWAA